MKSIEKTNEFFIHQTLKEQIRNDKITSKEKHKWAFQEYLCSVLTINRMQIKREHLVRIKNKTRQISSFYFIICTK